MMEVYQIKALRCTWPEDEYTRLAGLLISRIFSVPRCDMLASQQQVMIFPPGRVSSCRVTVQLDMNVESTD